MKICLLSDTHGILDDVVLKHIHWSDEIWHAGDIGSFEVLKKMQSLKPLRAVSGNIDGKDISLQVPELNHFQVEGLNIMIFHIGGYPPRYNKTSRELIKNYKPDVFITGHSHILKVMKDRDNDLIYLNPGAAGHQGFHKKRTLLRFRIEQGTLKDLEVAELGFRGR